jgi:nitrous oxidase accessory protein NosD
MVGLPAWTQAAAPSPTLSLSPASGLAGVVVTVSGSNFGHTTVQLTWDGSAAGMPSVAVGGNGSFSTTFKVPASTTGTHDVRAASVLATTTNSSQTSNGNGNGNKKPTATAAASAVFLFGTVAATPAPTAAPTQAPTATPAPTAAPTATPAPTATVAPSSAPLPSPSPTSAPLASCSGLQSLINGASVGTTVSVPACIYREQVVISKSLTLQAQPGAEIRGSDIWTGWSGNVSSLTVPSFPTNGNCAQARCAWPEQVFVDGVPQTQLAAGSSPSAGQFALDAARHVLLGYSPAGHTVEVTTRRYWLTIQASDVTVSGFRMRHAAVPPQDGGLRQLSGDRATISNNVLSDTHGGVLSLNGGTFHRLLNNDVSRGGQEGIHIGGPTGESDVLVQGNRIHDNNTEGFDCGWECGGLKTALQTRLTIDNNEVDHNLGPGLWCDIQCRDVVFSNNRVHHNSNTGISFEISTGAKIFSNRVWENGWSFTAWGWGAGILVSSGGGAEIYNNILAWNADGVSVISQNRPDAAPATNNYVHDNTVVEGAMASDASDKFMVGWLQDWAGSMFNAASNNRGATNLYWNTQAEPTCRFAWSSCVNRIIDFNATPGEEGARYLTDAEMGSILGVAGIPTSPQAH